MRKPIFTVLAALTAVLAAPAAAEQQVSVTVPYGDLDLTTPAGVTALEARIAAAVDKVCDRVEPRLFNGYAAWQECKALTLADAMEQLAAVAPTRDLALAASAEN